MGLLRVLLAISVVFAHSSGLHGEELVGGRTAVECFFVISGFYMALVMDRKYGALRTRRWSTFMASRIGRLMPVYLVVLAATVVTQALHAHAGGSSRFIHGVDTLSPAGVVMVAVSSVVLLGQDVLTFTSVGASGIPVFTSHPIQTASPGAYLLPIPPAWSLGVELLFYLLVPWILRWSTRRLVALALASLVVKLVLLSALPYDPWTYRFFPAELMYFIAGALAYRFLTPRLASMRRWVGVPVLAVVLAAVVAYPTRSTGHAADALAVVFPLATALAVPVLFRLTQRSSVDRWIGELSYPLYLVHVPVRTVLENADVHISGRVLLPTALGVAAVLLVLVDRPAESYRQRRLTRAVERRSAPATGAQPGTGANEPARTAS